jgi:2-hydroxychromene-2-carboxylate isomerase
MEELSKSRRDYRSTVDAILNYDFGSPYAYLAVMRSERVLGIEPRFEPVVLGVIFRLRGSGSWGHTAAAEENFAEIERRRVAYGLEPVVYPEGWPQNTMHAMRAALWAERHSKSQAFTRAAFVRAFARRADLTDHDVLRDIAAEVGLPAGELEDAIAADEIKDDLKARTQAAIDAGVRGLPALRLDGRVYYGDDRLEDAAIALRSSSDSFFVSRGSTKGSGSVA